jgi:hypothetical protein
MKADFRKIPTVFLSFRSVLCLAIFALSAVAISLVDLGGNYRLIIESSTFESYQVFYHTGPAGFDAPDSATYAESIKKPDPGRIFYTLSFPIPNKPLLSIRVDPGMRGGKILFKSIRVQAGRFFTVHQWQAAEIVRDFKPWNHIAEFSDQGGVLIIQSTGNDPHFLLPWEHTRRIFNDINSSVQRIAGIVRVLMILCVAFFIYRFSHEIDLLTRTFLDIVRFVLGRVLLYLKRFMTLRWIGDFGFHQALLVILFLTAILLPALDKQFHFLPQMESTEKRNLAKEPPLNLKQLSTFPEDYEKYFNDHFGLRNYLVRWHSLLQFKWLKISSMPAVVVIGKDGWLFNSSNNMIEDFRGLLSYSREDLIKIRDRIERDTAILNRKGILYLIVICPNKDTIYPEFMPNTITRVKKGRRLDQLTDFLKIFPDIPLVDLRNALRNAKESYPLYYKLDTHWNAYAGFVAYQEVMKEITKGFKELSPLKMADFEISTEIVDQGNGDLVSPLAMNGILPEIRVTLYRKNNLNASKKIRKILIFHDSFIHSLHPYLEHDFEAVILRQHQERTIDHNLIENAKPDVVIFQVAERFQQALFNESIQ